MNVTFSTYLTTIAFTITTASSHLHASPESISEQLKEIAERLSQNQNAMKTWQGTVEQTYMGIDDNKPVIHLESFIDFSYDKESKKYATITSSITNRISERTSERHGEIASDDKRYLYNDISGNNVLTIDHLEAPALKHDGRSFIPSDALKYGGIDLAHYLSNISTMDEEKLNKIVKIEKDQDLVSILFDFEHTQKKFIFSTSQNWSFVHSETTRAADDSKWELNAEYQKINNIWVPVSIERKTLVHNNGIPQLTTRSIRIPQQWINEPLPDDAFDPKKLGVAPGDYVNDKTIGLRYVYSGNHELTKVPDLNADPNLDIENANPLSSPPQNQVADMDAHSRKHASKETKGTPSAAQLVPPLILFVFLVAVLYIRSKKLAEKKNYM